MKALKKTEYKERVIYVADGYIQNDPDTKQSNYRTIWAIGKGEDMELGHIFYTPILCGTTPGSRCKRAEKYARQVIDDMGAENGVN